MQSYDQGGPQAMGMQGSGSIGYTHTHTIKIPVEENKVVKQ